MATRKKKNPENIEVIDKNALLADILEQRFNVNKQQGSLLPLGMSKSTSAISGLLVKEPEKNIPLEINLPHERAQIKLSYMIDRDANVSSRMSIDAFDREVHDAVISLYSSGISTFTTNMVFSVLTGKTSPAYPSRPTPAQIEKIESSIEKCIMNRISIMFELNPAEQETFAEILTKGEKGKVNIEQPLLNLSRGEFLVGNAKCNAYQFLSPPALLEYARTRSYIQLLPSRLVAMPLSFTDTNLAARGVLSQRILEAYASGKASCVVLFSEIDKDYEESYKQKRRRLRLTVTEILEFWIKEGFIEGYSFKAASRTSISLIVIELKDTYSPAEFMDLTI